MLKHVLYKKLKHLIKIFYSNIISKRSTRIKMYVNYKKKKTVSGL